MDSRATGSYFHHESGPAPPPGTLQLFSEDAAETGRLGELVLVPTPSDDYNDPLNWSSLRKAWNYGLLAAMTMSVFAALSIQTVFWPQMLDELDLTLRDLNGGQAAQLVGLAFGCIVFIPFAKKYGRRPAYIASTLVVTASLWWSSRMKTATEVLVTNVLLGLAGSVNETAVQMSIRDLFFVHQRGTASGLYLLAVTAGSFLTPMAAGAQAVGTGWRSSYTTLAVWMSGLCVLFLLSFEETKFVLAPASARDLGRKLSRVDSSSSMCASGPRPALARRLRLQLVTRTDEPLWRALYRPLLSAWFPHVVFTWLEFASGVCWVVVVSSITSTVFSRPPYAFDAAQIGFMAAGPLVGSVVGSVYGGPLVDWAVVRFARRNRGLFEPEMRLWLLPLPALAMSAGLAVFGITADRGMHFMLPATGAALFAYGFGSISDMTFTLVIDSFPNIVSQTFVAIAFFRNAISIAGPFSITPWMEVMSISSIFLTAAAISLAIHLLALPLVIRGKRMRAGLAPLYYHLCEESA